MNASIRRFTFWLCVAGAVVLSHVVHHQMLNKHWEDEWFLHPKIKSYRAAQDVLEAWNQLRLIDEAVNNPERLESRRVSAKQRLYERSFELAESVPTGEVVQANYYHSLDALGYAWRYFLEDDNSQEADKRMVLHHKPSEIRATVTRTLRNALTRDQDYVAWIERSRGTEEVARMIDLLSR